MGFDLLDWFAVWFAHEAGFVGPIHMLQRAHLPLAREL